MRACVLVLVGVGVGICGRAACHCCCKAKQCTCARRCAGRPPGNLFGALEVVGAGSARSRVRAAISACARAYTHARVSAYAASMRRWRQHCWESRGEGVPGGGKEALLRAQGERDRERANQHALCRSPPTRPRAMRPRAHLFGRAIAAFQAVAADASSGIQAQRRRGTSANDSSYDSADPRAGRCSSVGPEGTSVPALVLRQCCRRGAARRRSALSALCVRTGRLEGCKGKPKEALGGGRLRGRQAGTRRARTRWDQAREGPSRAAQDDAEPV